MVFHLCKGGATGAGDIHASGSGRFQLFGGIGGDSASGFFDYYWKWDSGTNSRNIFQNIAPVGIAFRLAYFLGGRSDEWPVHHPQFFESCR